MGSVGAKSDYVSKIIANNPWLQNESEQQQKAMIDYYKQMPLPQQWWYSLSNDEQKAISDYQMSSATISDEQAQQLKSAINKFKLNDDVVVYRGVSENEFNNFGNSTETFKSTSVNESTANNFAKNHGGYIIEYHLSKGANVADLSGSPNDSEKEYLINKGVKYSNVEKKDKRLIVHIK